MLNNSLLKVCIMRRRENPLPPDINARLQQARLALEKDPRAVFAYLFGGFGRGKSTPLSDIDIAVYLDRSADVSATKLDLIGAFMQALDTDEVDIGHGSKRVVLG
jgi:predicted nucleotidyltransferase